MREPVRPGAAVLIALAVLGCSDDDAGQEAEPSAAAEAPADKAEPASAAAPAGDGEADAGEPEPEGEPLNVLLKESRLLGNVPAKQERPALHTRLEDDQIAVLIEHLDTDCGPAPRFEARLVEGVVEVRMQPPAEDTGCTGPHDVKLRIDRPSEPPERLRVFDPEGRQMVEGPVESGG